MSVSDKEGAPLERPSLFIFFDTSRRASGIPLLAQCTPSKGKKGEEKLDHAIFGSNLVVVVTAGLSLGVTLSKKGPSTRSPGGSPFLFEATRGQSILSSCRIYFQRP